MELKRGMQRGSVRSPPCAKRPAGAFLQGGPRHPPAKRSQRRRGVGGTPGPATHLVLVDGISQVHDVGDARRREPLGLHRRRDVPDEEPPGDAVAMLVGLAARARPGAQGAPGRRPGDAPQARTYASQTPRLLEGGASQRKLVVLCLDPKSSTGK